MVSFRTCIAIALALLLTTFFLVFYRPHLLVSIIFPTALAIEVGRFGPNRLPMLSGILVFAANAAYAILQEPGLAGTNLLLVALAAIGLSIFFGAIIGLIVEAALAWLHKRGPIVF